MVQNLSQTGMTVSSSPGAHNGSFGTPGALGLGVDLGSTTPGQMSNLLGGTAMMPTMSDLGLSSRSGKKNEDEERREKMRKVLKNIGKRKGRVSQEGIMRIGRRGKIVTPGELASRGVEGAIRFGNGVDLHAPVRRGSRCALHLAREIVMVMLRWTRNIASTVKSDRRRMTPGESQK